MTPRANDNVILLTVVENNVSGKKIAKFTDPKRLRASEFRPGYARPADRTCNNNDILSTAP